MFKQLTCILLIAALITQTFSKNFMMLDYYANKSSFAKLCINKSMPAMNCNGRCLLMKKLKQEEKHDQQNPNRKLNNSEEVIFTPSNVAHVTFDVLLFDKSFSVSSTALLLAGFNSRIFHPPASV